nr:hypothetical protein [Plesiomonas shigelloides]
MTVNLIDKRRPKERISGVDLANGTWFEILSINGMDKLINTQHTNDPLNVTPAKAKKMAKLVDKWNPPAGWGGYDPVQLKIIIVNFLWLCNGFRSS